MMNDGRPLRAKTGHSRRAIQMAEYGRREESAVGREGMIGRRMEFNPVTGPANL